MSQFTYMLPTNFNKRVVQYLQQEDKALADAFGRCKYEYQDLGLAFYAGLKGDNWDKNAIDITIEGRQEDIDLLATGEKYLSAVITKSLKSNESGLLLKNLYYLPMEDDNSFIEIKDEIEEKFIEISNRQASFDEMSIDEKLAEIVNLLENMLKNKDKYIEIDYSNVCFEYITNDIIKKYRKQLHCFRHSSDEAISERRSYSEEQKDFLIDYGLTIINAVHELKNKR